jgi:hypothetical protein
MLLKRSPRPIETCEAYEALYMTKAFPPQSKAFFLEEEKVAIGASSYI